MKFIRCPFGGKLGCKAIEAVNGLVDYEPNNTIPQYFQCINSVNQVFPMRGKKISIAQDLLSHSLSVRLIAIRLLEGVLSHSLSTRLIPAYRVWCTGQWLVSIFS